MAGLASLEKHQKAVSNCLTWPQIRADEPGWQKFSRTPSLLGIFATIHTGIHSTIVLAHKGPWSFSAEATGLGSQEWQNNLSHGIFNKSSTAQCGSACLCTKDSGEMGPTCTPIKCHRER